MGTGFDIADVLTGIITIKRVAYLGRFNACTRCSYLVDVFRKHAYTS